MSNEQKDPNPKKTPYQIGLWVVIGAGIGILLGIFFHNIPTSLIFGAALGLVFGAALSQSNKK
jgi:F0F1-type ATP synthase assembly protein I